jgi:hypothetical protein
MHEKWTSREITLLKKQYPKKSLKELMKLLPGRCYDGIRTKARRLGLKK